MAEEGSDAQLKRVADWDRVGWLLRAEADRNALEEHKLLLIAEIRSRRHTEPGQRGDPEHDEAPPADVPHDEYDPTPD